MEFIIEYYEYYFDYLITITNQFTINALSIQSRFVPYWTQTYGILLSS